MKNNYTYTDISPAQNCFNVDGIFLLPLGFSHCHKAEHRGCGRLKRGACLSPAESGASFGASGHNHDAQVDPKGL